MSERVGSILLLIAATLLIGDAKSVTAAEMQPGLWTFTQQTSAGGRVKQSRTVRCVRPAEAQDPVRYFAPHTGRGAAACELVENSVFGGRISSRLRCSAGPTTMEIASIISIDTPAHLTIRTTLDTSGQGKSRSVGMTGEGTRTGNCR